MFNCDALRQALSDLLDAEVEPRVQAEVERHLSDCAACRILYDSARKTLAVVSNVGTFELPTPLSERLVRRILETVLDPAAPAAACPMPPPDAEKSRLDTLASYGVLDTPPERPFDDLVRLASRICEAPIALISLVDRDRQWFKARIGLDVGQMTRDVAFCAHAILGSEVMVVPDAAADERFSGNPLVTGEPRIRFYAGAPLRTADGHALGTLCVLDRIPRDLSEEQRLALETLSREVVARLDLARALSNLDAAAAGRRVQDEALRSSEEFKTRIIECSRDCIKVLDLDGRLLSMNAGGMEALEICDIGPFLGASWIDFWDGADREAAEAAVATARGGGMGRFVGYFETVQTRQPRWFDVVVNPILGVDGRPQSLLAVSRDVTDRKRSEDLFRRLSKATAAATGAHFFTTLVETLAAVLRVRLVLVTECNAGNTSVRTLAFWKNDGLSENIEYPLAGTPCEAVVGGETRFYPDRLCERFPDDTALADMGIQSFFGLPMVGRDGEVIGHLAVFDDRPMADASLEVSVLQIFADRAAAELERLRASKELESLRDRLEAENVYLQEEIRTQHNFEEIIGNAPPLLDALSKVERVAATDSTVLIAGETGSGKELFARAIHSRSSRSGRPLVKVNCGAIPAGLVESELFGHVRGAFTGALEKRVGRFELADGGTIFLDEIGELPPETQVKLLRVLQEREFEPVGSSRTVRVDVRIIAATNRDLDEEVRRGRFRADLLYRLNVFPISVPPLRERIEDLPLLVAFFLTGLSKRLGKKLDGFSRRAMQQLSAYSWPGNIRELQNMVERAAILAAGPMLEAEGLPFASSASEDSGAKASKLAEIERAHIVDVLNSTRGVVEGPRGAARLLGLHPNTLRSRLKKHGIEPRHAIS
jgi:formate hydrogenlyase transcriptional activator